MNINISNTTFFLNVLVFEISQQYILYLKLSNDF